MTASVAELEAFVRSPTHKDKGHRLYSGSFFALHTMPEAATSDALLGSVQRRLGLAGVSEGAVASCGTELLRRIGTLASEPTGAHLPPATWRSVLEGLASPTSQSQGSQRQLALVPLVPELANYTAAVRLRGSPWNPGQLAGEAIAFGSATPTEAADTWAMLHSCLALEVNDDAWAAFVEREIVAWRTSRVQEVMPTDRNATPALRTLDPDASQLYLGADTDLRPPSRQFAADLRTLIDLRRAFTRREWLAYLESLIRLGLVTHTQWLCSVHDAVWHELDSALRSEWKAEGLEERLRASLRRPLWSIGEQYSAKASTLARQYLTARFGLNLVLFTRELSARPADSPRDPPADFHSLVAFVQSLATWAVSFDGKDGLLLRLAELLESNPSVTNCRSGLTNNLREFWLYALAKRQTRKSSDAEYDQGAWCQKRGAATSSPWIVLPGPVALCLAVHCCAVDRAAGATVQDLQRYLRAYGVGTQQTDFLRGPLAARMRGLGIVVDSPDAEGGMSIIDPLQEVSDGSRR